MKKNTNTTSVTNFIDEVKKVVNDKNSLSCYIIYDKENNRVFINGYVAERIDEDEDSFSVDFKKLKEINAPFADPIAILKTIKFKRETDIFEYKYDSAFSDFVDTFIDYITVQTFAGYTLFYDKEEECFALNQHFEGEDEIVLEITFDEVEEANITVDDAIKMFEALTEKEGAELIELI